MKGYKFSMDKVLEIREKNEKKITNHYFKAKGSLNEEYEILNRLKKEIEEINISYGLLDISSLNYKNLYKSMLKNKIEKQLEYINNKEIELELIRLNLIEAQKEKKILEKIKKNDYEKYLLNIKEKENMELDETAILRYANKIFSSI